MSTKLSVPTNSEKLTFVLNDFSGGIVNNVNDAKMQDNQSPDMLNMQFRIDGLIQKRPGILFQKESPVVDGAKYEISDVIKYEYGAGEILMLYVNEYQMYYENEFGQPVVVFESIFAKQDLEVGSYPPLKIKYVNFNGALIFTDGLSLYSFNFEGDQQKPTTVKFVNPPADYTPKEKPAVTGDTKTSELKGVYKVMHYERENTHDYTDETYTIQDASGVYYIDDEGWYIYKNDWRYWDENSLGAEYYERWYEPCQYEMEDGYKGTNLLPPSIGVIAIHKDRLYVSGSEFDPNMIWISDILNPYYFPASMTLQTPPTDDYITALHNYNDALIIGRRNSLFALFGNTNRDDALNEYELVQLNTHTGMINDCSANKVFHMLFFVGSDGNLYKLLPPNTTSDKMYTTQLNTTLDLALPPFNLSICDMEQARSVFDGKEGLWYVQVSDHTLVYNYQLMAWTRYNNINSMRFLNIDNEIHFLTTFGNIYKMPSREGNQDYLDEYYDSMQGKVIKIPINAYWTSRNLDMGQPARVKQFRDTYVTTECFEDYPTTVNIKYEVDYVDISSTNIIENEIARWNKAEFGKSKFTSRNIDRSLPLMINRRGRTVKVFYGSAFKYIGSFWWFPEPSDVEEYDVFYSIEDEKFYQRVPRLNIEGTIRDKYFVELSEKDFSQALLVHNITGVYQLKGYR